MKDIAVFGMGKLGKTFAMTYSQKGGKVFAIDKRQDRIESVADYVTYAIRADVTEENVVQNLGINNVDIVFVAMGDNFEESVIVTAVCKSLGVPYIIAAAMDMLQGDVLKKIGADEIIFPESEMGKRIASSVASGGNFLDIADLSDEFSIIEAKVPKSWVGQTLIDINPRKKYGINVIALKTGENYENDLAADRPFEENESIVVIGKNEKLLMTFKK